MLVLMYTQFETTAMDARQSMFGDSFSVKSLILALADPIFFRTFNFPDNFLGIYQNVRNFALLTQDLT